VAIVAIVELVRSDRVGKLLAGIQIRGGQRSEALNG
jgi:hypothetical protein